MKLLDRERVDGIQITIGRRIYTKKGKKFTASKYSAEFMDHDEKQLCRSLQTSNVAHARREAIKI